MPKGQKMTEETKAKLASRARRRKLCGRHLKYLDWFIAYDFCLEQGLTFQETIRCPALGKLRYCSPESQTAVADLLPHVWVTLTLGPNRHQSVALCDLFDLRRLLQAMLLPEGKYCRLVYFGPKVGPEFFREHPVCLPRRLWPATDPVHAEPVLYPTQAKRLSVYGAAALVGERL